MISCVQCNVQSVFKYGLSAIRNAPSKNLKTPHLKT